MTTMKKVPSRIDYAQNLLQGRLHRAAGDKRCGCGACAHQVAVASRRAGITPADLAAALTPIAAPQRPRTRVCTESHVRICDSATIRVRGNGSADMAAFLTRFHDPD